MAETKPHAEPASGADRVCVGVIARPKGVRGAVRITTYTARPEDVAAYGPVYANGAPISLAVREVVKRGVVAAIEGVEDRDAAAALAGTRLYVPRAALPAPGDDEFYYADLIGLRVELADGRAFGTVAAVHNFGAGDIIEVARPDGGETAMLRFAREVVTEVDVAGGRLVVAADAEAAGEAAAGEAAE